MSYCIAINSLEHLPDEDTLLIHYSILCTGTWYLLQQSTAYRNVCDTEWTVMYPNHQHPRHTDFPITVTSPGFPATFAWNYGGIQGIASEDFDDYHSYIVQLAIFNYDCYNTGQPIIIEPTGEVEYTGEPTGYPGEETGGGGPGGGPSGPGGPGGPGSPGGPGVGGPGGGGNEEEPYIPLPPETPTNPEIPPYITPGVPPYSQPQVPVGVGIPENPEGSGTIPSTSGGIIINITDLDSRVPEVPEVPSSSTSTSTRFTPVRNPAIPVLGGSIGIQANNLIDINIANVTNDGSVPSALFENVHGNRPALGKATTQTSSSQVNYNNNISLVLHSYQVVIGTPIIISCVMTTQESITAKMQLLVQDNSTSNIVAETAYLNVNSSNPLTCGISTLSNIYNLGNLVVTAKVFVNEQLVGIKSVTCALIEPSNEGSTHGELSAGQLPTAILNGEQLSASGIQISIPEGSSTNLILSSEEPITQFSAVFQGGNLSDGFSLTVYNATTGGSPATTFNSGQLSGNVHYLREEAYSNNRYRINNSEVYLDTHNVALSTPVLSTQLIMLEVAPAAGGSDGETEGVLYLSDSVRLRPVSVTINPSTVTANLPYSNVRAGLIVHGYSPNITTSMVEGTTNAFGQVTWAATILPTQYYSIIVSLTGPLNLFETPIYTERYMP